MEKLPPAAVRTQLDFLSGAWLWVANETLGEQRHTITRQYQLINTALSLLMVLSIVLIIGSTYVFIREHELALLRTGFVATVSHELRTPLSLIQLHAETIYHDRAKPEKIKTYLRTIVAETERMTGLVNNVVDYSRLGSQACSQNPRSCDLSRLCEGVIRTFQYRFDTDGIQFRETIPPNIVVHIDPQIFSQIIFNLMDNAVKYSGESKYVALELQQNAERVQLIVTDHGIGIPDKIKPKIFEAFFRSRDRRVTEQRGSGIGLSVVKDLIEKSGSSIQVADAQPTGTIFTITIPRNNQ
jgi:signal transduction histidine kinase